MLNNVQQGLRKTAAAVVWADALAWELLGVQHIVNFRSLNAVWFHTQCNGRLCNLHQHPPHSSTQHPRHTPQQVAPQSLPNKHCWVHSPCRQTGVAVANSNRTQQGGGEKPGGR